MKAVVYDTYGSPDVLKLQDVEKPTVEDDKVLVKIHAVSVNAGDWHVLRGDPFMVRLFFGLFKPKNKILGSDIAGKVEAVGKNVTLFKPGDEVFGNLAECGWGGFAEYVSACEDALAHKPEGITFEEIAAVPQAALTALQALRDHGKIQPGQEVLINGASGGVGTFAVQVAKAFDTEVTGVCSTQKMEMVRSIGADHVIDYTQEDFTRSQKQYDLILAANGYHSISDYKRALKPGGNYVQTGGSESQMYQAMLLGPWHSMISDKKMGNMLQRVSREDLLFLKQLVETGQLKPVIDRRYPLSDVPDAIRYLEQGHAQGKVVVSI
jgi:NADPH:quinone reductase-like Zn-dependent oxidoreductase